MKQGRVLSRGRESRRMFRADGNRSVNEIESRLRTECIKYSGRWDVSQSGNGEGICNTLLESRCITYEKKVDSHNTIVAHKVCVSSEGGKSVKTSNVFFNMKKLVQMLPSVISRGLCIISGEPVKTVFIVLGLLVDILKLSTVEVTKERAFILAALGKNCSVRKTVDVEKGFEIVNTVLQENDEPVVDYKTYQKALDFFVKLRCIDIKGNTIRLREKIKVEI